MEETRHKKEQQQQKYIFGDVIKKKREREKSLRIVIHICCSIRFRRTKQKSKACLVLKRRDENYKVIYQCNQHGPSLSHIPITQMILSEILTPFNWINHPQVFRTLCEMLHTLGIHLNCPLAPGIYLRTITCIMSCHLIGCFQQATPLL